MNLAVLAPVWQAFTADARIGVRFTGSVHGRVADAFQASGISHLAIAPDAVRLRRWDLYLNADPWEALTLWRCRRRVTFFHGVAGKYDLDCPVDVPLDFGAYDRVAFPNTGRMQRYLAAGIVQPGAAALIGFPKLDALVNSGVSARSAAQELALSPGRPTVIYAPTFSPQSSLEEHGEPIVRALLDSGFNVIVKLHDRSLDPDPRYSGGGDWRRRFAAFARPGQFLFAEDADSARYLLAADVMITDHSTIGFEFCALDRPLIVFDVPALLVAARVASDKAALLRGAGDLVSAAGQVPGAVRQALQDPQRLSAERAFASNQVFFDPGRATARALALCYGLLQERTPAGKDRSQEV